MDKKHKQHLLVTLIFTLIVTATLFFMYDDFVFQTYGEVVYYDYILKGENNQLKVENIEAYLDRQSFHLGEGRIIFKDVNLTNGAVPTVKLSLYGENQQKFDYEFVVEEYHSDTLIYSIQSISKKYKEIDLDDVKSASLTIKEYRIENASISNSMMRLGTLKAASDDVIKEYPTVSLEYRYLKDKNGDKEDNDNYVVFKKITGKSKELVNGNDYGTYNLEDDSFKDKDLSVVIIFSNGKEKFAFAIDLKTREVGDYYG